MTKLSKATVRDWTASPAGSPKWMRSSPMLTLVDFKLYDDKADLR
jgi:hypothetical protein